MTATEPLPTEVAPGSPAVRRCAIFFAAGFRGALALPIENVIARVQRNSNEVRHSPLPGALPGITRIANVFIGQGQRVLATIMHLGLMLPARLAVAEEENTTDEAAFLMVIRTPVGPAVLEATKFEEMRVMPAGSLLTENLEAEPDCPLLLKTKLKAEEGDGVLRLLSVEALTRQMLAGGESELSEQAAA